MLTREQIASAARRLDSAEKTRAQIGLLSLEHPQMDMADAYAIQAAWVAMKCAAGRSVKGHKIGLTSRAMQQALGIDIPDSGVLLDDMFFDDQGDIPTARFIATRIEAELAFILKAPLSGPDLSIDAVLDATDFILPAFEILDTRIVRADPATGKARNVFDTIADNAANAGIVMGGQPLRPRDWNIKWIGAIVSRNGIVEETGLAAGVLGHPALGIAWLAGRLHAQGAAPLQAGDVVLSGSFIRPIEARAGDAFVADYGPCGTVSCRFV